MHSLANVLIFSGPRGSGRTTALINWALEDPLNRAILVADSQRRDNVLALARHMQGPMPGFPVWHLRWQIATTSGSRDVGIDDYDQLQGEILPFPAQWVRAVTLESDEYKNIPCPITIEDAIAGLTEIERDLR